MALIYQYPIPVPMTVGSYPQFKYGIFGDAYESLITAGYLNSYSSEAGIPLSNADVIMCLYSYSQQTGTGTFGVFTVSISSATGQIVLSPWSPLTKQSATEAAGAITSNGQSGILTTAALTTAAGAATNITVTNSLCTAASVIQLSLMGGTNTVGGAILAGIPSDGSFVLNIYNNNAADALNGTLDIGYVLI